MKSIKNTLQLTNGRLGPCVYITYAFSLYIFPPTLLYSLQIKYLFSLKVQHFLYMAAELIEEMQKVLEELNAMADTQKGRVENYETSLQNIAIAFLVWLRLFFFSLSQTSPNSSLLHCKQWWLLFALTCFSAFLYILLFIHNSLMLSRTERQLHVISRQQIQLHQQIWMLRLQELPQMIEPIIMDHIINGEMGRTSTFERKLYINCILCGFIGIVALELYASRSLLCNA